MIRNNSSQLGLVLILGDILAFFFALILTLTIRYEQFPNTDLLIGHLHSFSILFAIFIIVSFSAGLYNKQSFFVRKQTWSLLIKVQIVNIFIGIAFFYLAPVGISPKANLVIYFIISTILLLIWRTIMFPVLHSSRNQIAILIGEGDDIDDLYEEVVENTRYGLTFREKMTPQDSVALTVSAIGEAVRRTNASAIVADLRSPSIESAMPFLYSLIFSGVQVIDASRLYESIFDRIPLSMVGERWLVEHSATALGNRRVYDLMKRMMDIVLSFIIGIISLVFYPFVYIAIKLDDQGPIFITQKRVGKNGKVFQMLKFRSMTANDDGVYEKDTNGANVGKSEMKITRVGRFIRMTRIDELPQLWSVLTGDQSLTGPRPELPSLVTVYNKEIPHYNARHLVKPGLSGWAQIYHQAHPHHAVAVEDTRDKLSYDLYYVKNRSIGLDIKIALQTLRALISKQGV